MRKHCAVFFLVLALPLSAMGQAASQAPKPPQPAQSGSNWPWNFVAKFRPGFVKSLHFAGGRPLPTFGSDSRPNTIIPLPFAEQRLLEAQRKLSEVAEMVRAGLLDKAELKLKSCESILGQRESFAGLRIRILVETGRIDEASAYCARALDQGSPPSIVSLAAMVVALNGEVYPGQVEFCRWAVVDATRFASLGSPEDWPAIDDPRNEAIVLGALGAELQSTLSPYRDLNDYFLLVALDRQPDNPLANFRLGKIRSEQQLYDEAKRYMRTALAVAKGGLAEAIRIELEMLERRIKATGGGG